jgi:hypothetical protein
MGLHLLLRSRRRRCCSGGCLLLLLDQVCLLHRSPFRLLVQEQLRRRDVRPRRRAHAGAQWEVWPRKPGLVCDGGHAEGGPRELAAGGREPGGGCGAGEGDPCEHVRDAALACVQA